jgi:tetratricopeptide (TPR) repeat protein
MNLSSLNLSDINLSDIDLSNINKFIENKQYYKLGLYYQFNEINNKLTKKYYNLDINEKYSLTRGNSMNNLGFYYSDVEKNYDKSKKYFLDAIQNNNYDAYNNLGLYYYNIEKNYEKAKEYYLLACEHDIPEAFNNLGLYYYEIDNNYDISKLYFIEALKRNVDDAINNIKLITTPLERYIIFRQNCISIEEYNNTNENDENNDRQVIIFKNRLNFCSKFMECIICMNDYMHIPLECSHYICVDCYPKIIKSQKCPICRIQIYS